MVFMTTNSSLKEAPEYDIELNNCGYYKKIGQNNVRVERANGRRDCQIIFVECGCVDVMIDGKIEQAHTGRAIFFPPYVPQRYCYAACQDASYYWIHFDGLKLQELFSCFPFQHKIYPVRQIHQFTAMIDDMLINYARLDVGRSLYLNAQMQSMVVNFGLNVFRKPAESPKAELVRKITTYIRETPEDLISNQQLAEQFDISEYHLIRIMKQETGYTPHRYRNMILLEKAKQLLRDTTLNVSEISYMLHFEDPLYFSRLFRNYTGLSPSGFRREEIMTR